MRRGFSPTRSKVTQELEYRKERDQVRRVTNPSVNYWKYFCHYNNAVYQGGMSAYKKHGKGLLLHDDGAAVITDYLHDTPNGHNIIFRENSIASVLFKSASEYEIVYKTGKSIIKIPFAENSERANGLGVLIDYQSLKIYQLVYKKGTLVDKILHLNRSSNEDAFKNNTIAKLVGLKHQQAFDLTFQKPQTMHVKYDKNELVIGYFDETGEKHGLSFTMYAENVDISGQKSLYLKSIERGYYKSQKLSTFGQKYFSNGNKFIGQFQAGQFQGYGILLCPQQMKWVYGKFSNGRLSEVLDSNNKRYTENQFQMWSQGLLEIHRRYRERWIDFDVELPDQLYLYGILKDAIKKPVTEVDPDYEEAAKEDQYRMSRIQQQFLEGYPGDEERSYVDLELDKHYTVRSNRPGKSEMTARTRTRQEETPRNSKKILIEDPLLRETGQVTPINRVEEKYSSKTPKYDQVNAEKQHRMRDPFEIELIKVPVSEPYKEKTSSKESPYASKDRVKQLPLAMQYQPLRQSRQSRQSRQNKFAPRYPAELQTRRRYQAPYSRPYVDQLEKQRERFKQLQRNDQEYMRYLRNGISRSPVHRDYYNTPPRFDPSSTRYNGKIINKKVFNYQEPTSPYRQSPQRSKRYQTNAEEPKRKEEAFRQSKNSPYKSSPRNQESLEGRSSFIENNYKHWK